MTMPFSRSSGPGAPMPTPRKSRHATAPVSAIVSLITSSISPTIRSATASAPGLGARRDGAHGVVLRAVGRHRADDDVGAAEIHADDVLLLLLGGRRLGRHESGVPGDEKGARQGRHVAGSNLAHTAPMSEGAAPRAVPVARATLEPFDLRHGGALGQRAEAEGRDGRPEHGEGRRVHGRREMQRRRVVRHQQSSAADHLGRREQRETAGGVDRTSARRVRDLVRERAVRLARRRRRCAPRQPGVARGPRSTATAWSPRCSPARARSMGSPGATRRNSSSAAARSPSPGKRLGRGCARWASPTVAPRSASERSRDAWCSPSRDTTRFV